VPAVARKSIGIFSAGVLFTSLAFPALAHGAAGWAWPVRGPVITSYRNGTDPYAAGQHRGIDIAAPSGAPVAAATAGTVRFAGRAGFSGLVVAIRTADGRYDTSYLHLSAIGVAKGQRVSLGQRVGAVGTTGRRSARRPHLHFGVRDAGSRHAYHDPLDFLPPPGRPAPEAPRGAPAPVRVPARPRPAPAVRPVPPQGEPLGVPAGRPAPAPSPRTLPSTLPSPGLTPLGVPGHPAFRSHPAGLGAAPGPLRGPVGGPLPIDAPTAGMPGRSDGIDIGRLLACLGLLLSAAFMGGNRAGRSLASRGRARLRAALRPVAGLSR
jgi:Peptidase family M23